MIRAVLDVNTLVSAVINVPLSVSRAIYQHFIQKHFELITSPSLIEELEDVLNRDHVMKLHKRSPAELQKFISQLAKLSLVVPETTEIEIVRDPDDDKIIAAAIEGKADYIVSRDRDLLDLKEYEGIKIVSPETFIHLLRQ